MSEKRIGTLIYDPSMGRYDIRFGIESYYGGLHCGECFDVKVRDVWIPVRIEMDEDWYLVGLPKTTPRRADCSDVEEIDDGSQKEICKARLPICDRSGEYSGMSV